MICLPLFLGRRRENGYTANGWFSGGVVWWVSMHAYICLTVCIVYGKTLDVPKLERKFAKTD